MEKFENLINSTTVPVLVDFYATWCGPCKMLAPVVHEIAEENAGTLKVGKINVDEQMELAMRFQVSSIPMLVVFKDGKAVAKSVPKIPSVFPRSSLVGKARYENVSEFVQSPRATDAA